MTPAAEQGSGAGDAPLPAPVVGTRFALSLTVVVAFLVRLLHVLSREPWPTGDMSVFVSMATHSLTLENLFTPEGACRYAPGYAIFLKPFLLVLEPFTAFAAVRVAQALLGALTCLLVYRIARRLHSRRAGLAAALLTCFFHHFIFYASVYMSENLFIPVWLAALLAFLHAGRKGGARRAYVAGLLAGAALLVRPAAIALAPLALAAAWRAVRDPGRGRPVRRTALALVPALAGALTLLAPWALRNWIAIGSPVLVAPTTTVSLAVGNTSSATGGPMDVETPGLKGEAREAELRARVAEFVTGDPWGALYVTLRLKWEAFWAGVPPWPLDDGNPSLLAGGLFFPFVSWRLALVLGLVGLGFLVVRDPRAALLSGSCAAAYVAFHLVFFGQPRFRMPLEALFLAWGGIGITACVRALGGRSRRHAASGALAASLVLVGIVTEVSAAALVGRGAGPRDLIAHGAPLRLPVDERVVALFGPEPVPLDRTRGRYVRLSLMARRTGPPRATPANGVLRITFLDEEGLERSWLNAPSLRLDSLPPERWTTLEIKHHIPQSAVAARVELLPSRSSPDMVRLDQISLRYDRGNDLALEFLFPYLRRDE